MQRAMVSTKAMPASANAMSWSPLQNQGAGLLQRKCACGGTPGSSGECAACRAKRLAKKATAGGSSRAATAPAQGRGYNFAAVRVERKDGVVHGPAGTANHWDDCPPTWRPKANAAQALGGSWVDNVVNGLSSVLALPPPIPKPVETLLLKHFHTSANKDIATINGRHKKIQTAIHSSLNFEYETELRRERPRIRLLDLDRPPPLSVLVQLRFRPPGGDGGPRDRARRRRRRR